MHSDLFRRLFFFFLFLFFFSPFDVICSSTSGAAVTFFFLLITSLWEKHFGVLCFPAAVPAGACGRAEGVSEEVQACSAGKLGVTAA